MIGGWLAVAVGTAGVVVPGLPTTGPFVLAASCFAKSSPRFERWVLSLPHIGPMVRDHRAGLGMPRRAKVVAVSMIVVAVSASTLLAIPSPVAKGVTVVAGLVGCWYVGLRIPTRERILAARGASGPSSGSARNR
ncbi:MAG: YbaN family protein [Acidimicrobiia bacterium]|nr:YbaN family protein [Acidimicrobiia bacterium]